ncbi:hypothetical protein MAPG_04932 [Magnaporthiopsis poae ATCC 64411]|uniref:ABM domain-containing protein n=1 Tax=Magnaporthiopsis poae (strain ATCC 64411 / 73-15) TaxID=644358 RepID=A0A0C4DY23_MAGP6|nr:hypothetical protein MAPG_04932 [Magnaporthiopsis poae ATCC 64411]
MTITELALLRLSGQETLTTMRPFLQRGKTVAEAWTRRPDTVRYFQQADDARNIYILGQWASLSEHMDGFIPSAGNQALMQGAADRFTIETFLHFQAEMPPRDDHGAGVYIIRNFCKQGARGAGFGPTMEKAAGLTGLWGHGAHPVAGWRVDVPADETMEEFVICGWTADGQPGVDDTDALRQYRAAVQEWVDKVEACHALEIVV